MRSPVRGRWTDRLLPGPLEPRSGQRQQLRRALEVPVCLGRVDVAQHGGEQRQLRLDVVGLAIPAQQCAQDERMTDVVQTGLTAECFAVQAGRAAELVEPPPHVVPARSSSPAREEKAAGSLGCGHN